MITGPPLAGSMIKLNEIRNRLLGGDGPASLAFNLSYWVLPRGKRDSIGIKPGRT
jgi:hypothetical protein